MAYVILPPPPSILRLPMTISAVSFGPAKGFPPLLAAITDLQAGVSRGFSKWMAFGPTKSGLPRKMPLGAICATVWLS